VIGRYFQQSKDLNHKMMQVLPIEHFDGIDSTMINSKSRNSTLFRGKCCSTVPHANNWKIFQTTATQSSIY
jgi:hypothetical protein